MKNTKKGFTLVELLVVIAILAILASVAVVGYTAFINDAKESNAKTEAHQIETAIEASLMVKDYVVVKETTTTTTTGEGESATTTTTTTYLVVAKDGTASEVTDLTTLEGDVDNIAENFAGFNLSLNGTKLAYTSKDSVTIDDILAD